MTTDRSVRRYIIATLLVLTGIMGLSVHSAANAKPTDNLYKMLGCTINVKM